jgi:hypothetical protein
LPIRRDASNEHVKLDPAPEANALPLEAASEDLAALAWLHESERDVNTLGRLHAGVSPTA